ncbi:MAG: acetate--CoA ligase family protein, partial [Deltaproteobacteria bacterium]|nr:acetate--CoA ligase family protein [Deltaproteobacteria bacterium]
QAAELAAAAGKPVLIIKAGRTELGAQAVGRHTGHQVGSDQEYQALFQKAGVVRLNSLAELMAASTILAAGKKIAGDRVGVLSPFGGAGVLLADECLRAGLRMAELAPSTTDWLAERLPSFASTLNPVDVTPQVMIRHELVEECAGAILADTGVDILIVCSWIWEGYEALQTESLSRISKKTKKLVVNLVWGPVESARKVRRALHRLRVPAEEEAEVITAALAGLAPTFQPSEGA